MSRFSQMFSAVKSGDLDTVKCLAKPSEINKTDESGFSMMWYAINYGYIDIIEYLFEKGAKICNLDSKGSNIITIAVKSGCIDLLKFCIRINFNLEYPIDEDKSTPLIYAVRHKNLEMITLLIGKVLIDAVDKHSFTALHYAVNNEDEHIVKFLLTNGANPDIVSCSNRTPLAIAVRKFNLKLVKLILEFGACPNNSDSVNRAIIYEFDCYYICGKRDFDEPLSMILIELNKHNYSITSKIFLEIIEKQFHLSMKALNMNIIDVNYNNYKGITALHYAVLNNDIISVKFLLENGANNLQNNKGLTPYNLAKFKSLDEIIKLFDEMYF